MPLILFWDAISNSISAKGVFSFDERNCHINVLELKAAYLGLKSLCRDLKETHIKILTDNTTAVHGINNMDSCKSVLCDAEVRKIWDWATERNNFLTATWPSQFWYPALFAILEKPVYVIKPGVSQHSAKST